MHSALYAVRIVADPHIGILIHLSAVGVEDIIVLAYLCEALGTYTVGEIEGESAAVGKAVLYKLSVCTEPVPAGSVEKLGRCINSLVHGEQSVCLCVVVFSVNLIETLGSK